MNLQDLCNKVSNYLCRPGDFSVASSLVSRALLNKKNEIVIDGENAAAQIAALITGTDLATAAVLTKLATNIGAHGGEAATLAAALALVLNDFSASNAAFKTSTGLNTIGGKLALKVIAAPVAAAGAAGGVAGAAQLGSANILAVSSDGATKGVKMVTGVAGDVVDILNTSGTACNLFAHAGGTINGGAADAGCAIPASTGVRAICTAADTWHVFQIGTAAGAAA